MKHKLYHPIFTASALRALMAAAHDADAMFTLPDGRTMP